MKFMIYLFIIIVLSINANSQNIIDSTTIGLPSLVIYPNFKKRNGEKKNLECNPAFIEFEFEKYNGTNLDNENISLLVDTSLARKILKKYYDYTNFGPDVMIDLSSIKGLGDGDLYSLKYTEKDYGMFKAVFETYNCVKGTENVQVKELIELKNKKEKFSKVKDVKVSQTKSIFPAPYIGVNDKLEIDIDSINRHMLNCSSLKLFYDEYYGSGNILNRIPEYVYHKNSNMQKSYSSDIFTYPVNQLQLNELADGRGILRNSRIDNNSDNMKQMHKFFSFITSNSIIGDTNYFPINWKTNKQENKIEYIFLGNKLSAMLLSFDYKYDKNNSCLWGCEGGESKEVKSKRDKCVDKFISTLDNQFGKSKVLRSIDFKHDIIRVWKKGNCTLSVMYRDLPFQKYINSITYCDEEYSNRYYQNILKSKNTSYDFNVIWDIFPQPINFVVSKKYK